MARPPRPRRTRPRFGVRGWVALLLLLLFCGVVPIAVWIGGRIAPDGVTVQQAVAQGSHSVGRKSSSGRGVDFRLPDGTRGSVYYGARFNYPDRGETIEVYREHGRWGSPQSEGVGTLVGGLAGGLFFGGIAVAALVIRPEPAAPTWQPLRGGSDRDAVDPENPELVALEARYQQQRGRRRDLPPTHEER